MMEYCPEARIGERGMTLVELLVATSILVLFIVVTDRIFLSVHQASRTTLRAADLQQNVRVAAMRLRREIRESRDSMVTCYPDPSCRLPSAQVAFPSARPADAASVFCLDVAADDPERGMLESACPAPVPLTGTYTAVWQRYVGYHLSPAGDLRRVVQAGPITLPLASTSGQVVASQVALFTVSRSGRLFRFTLQALSRDAGAMSGLPPQEMMLDDTVELRNTILRPAP